MKRLKKLQLQKQRLPLHQQLKRKTRSMSNSKFREPAYVDYKDVELIKRYLNEQGKILPRRITNVSAKFQRQLTRAVKRARHVALIPFVADSLK
jgi:small subunit ribosomal protein S18